MTLKKHFRSTLESIPLKIRPIFSWPTFEDLDLLSVDLEKTLLVDFGVYSSENKAHFPVDLHLMTLTYFHVTLKNTSGWLRRLFQWKTGLYSVDLYLMTLTYLRMTLFKTAVYVFKSLHGQSPSYVKDMTLWHSRPRNLRQHRAPTLQTPLLRKAVGRQSFSYSSAYVWNSLPLDIRNQQTLESFKRSLKTHLFLEAYSPWQDVFTMYFNLFVYNVFI